MTKGEAVDKLETEMMDMVGTVVIMLCALLAVEMAPELRVTVAEKFISYDALVVPAVQIFLAGCGISFAAILVASSAVTATWTCMVLQDNHTTNSALTHNSEKLGHSSLTANSLSVDTFDPRPSHTFVPITRPIRHP